MPNNKNKFINILICDLFENRYTGIIYWRRYEYQYTRIITDEMKTDEIICNHKYLHVIFILYKVTFDY